MPQKSTACTPVHPWYSRDAQKSEKASNDCSPRTQRPELSCWISSEDIPQWLCDDLTEQIRDAGSSCLSAELSPGLGEYTDATLPCHQSQAVAHTPGWPVLGWLRDWHCACTTALLPCPLGLLGSIVWIADKLDMAKVLYGNTITLKEKKKKTQQQQEKNHNSPWARQAESGWPSAQETWPLGAAQGHKAVQVHTASSQSHWFCDGDVWPAAPAQRLGWAVCVWLHLYHREWDRKTQLAQPLSTDAFSSVGPWFSSWHPPRQQLPPAFPSSKERFAWRIKSSNFPHQKRSGKQVFPLNGDKVLCS